MQTGAAQTIAVINERAAEMEMDNAVTTEAVIPDGPIQWEATTSRSEQWRTVLENRDRSVTLNTAAGPAGSCSQ